MPFTFNRLIGGTFLLLMIATPCVFAQEEERQNRNQGTVDLALQSGFDDQPLGIHRATYFQEAALHLSLQKGSEHLHWTLDYRPTFRRYDNPSLGNEVDHEAQFEGSVKFNRRWSGELHSAFLDSRNPFSRNQESPTAGDTGNPMPLEPGLGIVGPVRSYRTIDSSLTLHYELGPHARLNFGSNYFRDDEESIPVLSNDTRALHAGFEKLLGPRDTVGMSYSLQLFRVAVASMRVRTQSTLFVYGHQWPSRMRLDMFAGPQISLLQAEPTTASSLLFFEVPVLIPLHDRIVGYAAGASLSRRLTQHSSFEIGYSHRIADGGGITTMLVQDSARITVRHALKRYIEAALTGDYSENKALGGVGFSTPFPSWSVSPQIEFRLSRKASIMAVYNFARYERVPADLMWMQDHNRLVIGLRYSFGAFPF